jgi:adenine-specific DNA-methyltransferase
MIAAAVAKQEGFRYFPDEHIYWKQGKSSEKDFIYTTTQFVTVEILDKIKDEMQPDESLLIACKAFQQECENRHSNITIKKIPQMLLGRCEFGKDDYSLNIVDMPQDETYNDELEEIEDNEPGEKYSTQQGTLNFSDTDEHRFSRQ